MRKLLIINLMGISLLVGILEVGSRLYDRYEINALPAVPHNAEGFGDFSGFLRFTKTLMFLKKDVNSADYEPYSVFILKPNHTFRLKNINIKIDSFGFRNEEFAMAKPNNIFRIFIMGGSTVEGSFNDEWTISHYLAQELKAADGQIEVINAGIVGFSSQSELALLQTRILDLQPDMVVVLDGRNDLYYSTSDYWQNRRGEPYFSCKRALDGLINYPTFLSLGGHLARFLTQKSSALTRIFHWLFRRGPNQIYPREAKIKELAINTYIDNLRLMKAVLEAKKLKGIIAFQPTLGYAKEQLTPYEESIESYIKDVEKSDWLSQVSAVWPKVGRQVVDISNSGPVRTYDFSRLFEKARESAYIDSCHYTPRGCQIIGAKIAEIIRSDFGDSLDKFSRK